MKRVAADVFLRDQCGARSEPKNWLAFLSHAIISAFIAFGVLVAEASDVSVKKHPNWRAAPAEFVKQVRAQSSSYEILDVSVWSSGGVVYFGKHVPGVKVTGKIAGNVLAGFKARLLREGGILVSQEPFNFRRFPGYRLATRVRVNGGRFGATHLILFSDRAFFGISFLQRDVDSTSEAMISEYLSRISFSPAIVAGSLDEE